MEITKSRQWSVTPNGLWEGLKCIETPIRELEPTECLVKIYAASLNYRDVAIPMGRYPLASRDGVVPCSDGAGEVIAVGRATTRFHIGDRVCTAFNPAYQSGLTSREIRKKALGNILDGTLREYAIFDETALVSAPSSLNMLEASTLSCAAVTVWNCLFGLKDRALKHGDWVLTQGTGGVSLFTIQIALALGANVISTTSSKEKAERLKAMGVHHVINYKDDPNWGQTAKRLTPNEEGVHHVVEVGGDTTMPQSLEAIRVEGVISVVGFLSGAKGEHAVGFGSCLQTLAIVRGINVGPVDQFEACNAFIDEHKIKPIIDPEVFGFDEATDALKYLWNQSNYGKVVIRVH